MNWTLKNDIKKKADNRSLMLKNDNLKMSKIDRVLSDSKTKGQCGSDFDFIRRNTLS